MIKTWDSCVSFRFKNRWQVVIRNSDELSILDPLGQFLIIRGYPIIFKISTEKKAKLLGVVADFTEKTPNIKGIEWVLKGT